MSGTRAFYSVSSGSCMVRGGASMDQTCSSKSYRSLIRLGSGAFGGPVNTLAFVFLELFLSSVCGVSGHVVLLRGHCHRVVLLWWGGVFIHMDANIQGFPAEHCIVIRWSMLFTSPLCFLCYGWSVNKYICICMCYNWTRTWTQTHDSGDKVNK